MRRDARDSSPGTGPRSAATLAPPRRLPPAKLDGQGVLRRSARPSTAPVPGTPGAASSFPPLAHGGDASTRDPAYLVLDLGREPVRRALVEVGHGGSRGGKRLRSALRVSRSRVPRSWPRGVAAAREARSSLPWAVQETPRRGGGARAVPRLLGPTGSRRASRSAPESPHELPPPPPPGLQGLADGPGQWRAASSLLSDYGAGGPIEGQRTLRSLPARGSGPRPRPRPHAAETRG